MRRVVITGGAGFLGSHLCERALGRGTEVVVLDNLLTGSMDNIAHLLGHPAFSFRHQDVTEQLDVEGEVDAVLHFASPASPIDYALHADRDHQGGDAGHPQGAGAGQGQGGAIPARQHQRGLRRSRRSTRSRRPTGGTSTRSGRGASTTRRSGPPRRSPWPITTTTAWTRGSCGSSTPTARGCAGTTDAPCPPSSPRRSPASRSPSSATARRPAASATSTTSSTASSGCSPATAPCPVNIGNPSEITMLELARMVRDLCGSRSEIVFEPLPVDDPRRRRPDIGVARELLGWEPRVPLEQGLNRTIAWWRATGGGRGRPRPVRRERRRVGVGCASPWPHRSSRS